MEKKNRNMYERRRDTLKKKARELSSVCNVDVCMLCFGPNGDFASWPEDPSKARSVIQKYKEASDRAINNKRARREKLDLSDVLGLKIKALQKQLCDQTPEEPDLSYNGSLSPPLLEEQLGLLSKESLAALSRCLVSKVHAVERRIGFLKAKQNTQQLDCFSPPNQLGFLNAEVNQVDCFSPPNQLGFLNAAITQVDCFSPPNHLGFLNAEVNQVECFSLPNQGVLNAIQTPQQVEGFLDNELNQVNYLSQPNQEFLNAKQTPQQIEGFLDVEFNQVNCLSQPNEEFLDAKQTPQQVDCFSPPNQPGILDTEFYQVDCLFQPNQEFLNAKQTQQVNNFSLPNQRGFLDAELNQVDCLSQPNQWSLNAKQTPQQLDCISLQNHPLFLDAEFNKVDRLSMPSDQYQGCDNQDPGITTWIQELLGESQQPIWVTNSDNFGAEDENVQSFLGNTTWLNPTLCVMPGSLEC